MLSNKAFNKIFIGFLFCFASIYGSAARITRLAAPISRSAVRVTRLSTPVASISSLDAARKYYASSGPTLAQKPMNVSDAFKVLDVKQGSSSAQIKAAYHQRVKEVHPDVGGSDEAMKTVNQAYDIAKIAPELGSGFTSSLYTQKPANEQKELYQIITSGDLESFQNFIMKHSNMINQVMYNSDSYSQYPLAIAIHEALRHEGIKGLDIIQALLKAGANPNSVYQGESSLTIMQERGSGDRKKELDILTMLLNAGADPNISASKGVSALMLAVQRFDNQEVVDALLAAGANPNAVSFVDSLGNSNTPLSFALIYHNDQYVASLLKAGANPNIQISYKGKMCTVLHILIKQHAEYSKEPQDSFGATLVADAKKRIEDMLKARADVTIKDQDGKTAYDLALQAGNKDIAEMLFASRFPFASTSGENQSKSVSKKPSMWSWVYDVWK